MIFIYLLSYIIHLEERQLLAGHFHRIPQGNSLFTNLFLYFIKSKDAIF